jgi:hypothetical protein
MLRALVVVLGALALAACYDRGASCGDGYCPAGTVCAPAAELCLHPEQLELCRGVADGTACAIRDGRAGACHADLCLPVVCGDDRVDRGEECDGAALGAHADCLDLGEGYHQGGPLRCTSTCRYDRSTCGGRCGDGEVSGPEACDGGPGTRTCEDEGFYGGDLGCTAGCQLDVSACLGECGDGRRTSEEECDGTDFGASTCNTYGFYGGTLRCTADCTIEQDHCEGRCGDGEKNGPEVCDSADLGGLSCQTFGWYGGAVTCGANCLSLDRSACEGFCGDGVKNGNEQCDGLDHDDPSCTSIGALAGALGCNASCQTTNDGCYWGRARRVDTGTRGRVSRIDRTADGQLWALHEGSSVARFDGLAWHATQDLVDDYPMRIWSGSGEIWMSTYRGNIRRFVDDRWALEHESPFSKLSAFWATSADDLWLVPADDSRLMHFDGATWSTTADLGIGVMLMVGAGDELWIITDDERFLHYANGVVRDRTPPGEATHELWANHSDDVWTLRRITGDGDGLFHFDGVAWTRRATPARCRDGWGGADGNPWLVCGDAARQVLYRSHGGEWVAHADVADEVASGLDAGVSGQWIATSRGVVHVDGAGWAITPAGAAGAVTALLADAPDRVWAIQAGAVLRYDGAHWADLGLTQARSLWFDGEVLWVGGRRAITRVDGAATRSYPMPDHIDAIAGTGADDVWAASFDSLVHFDGIAWSSHPIEGMTEYVDLATTPDALWVVGNATRRREGGTWHDTGLDDVVLFSASLLPVHDEDVWLQAETSLLRYDGQDWSLQDLHDSAGIVTELWGLSSRDIWAVTDIGLLVHYDGLTWTSVATGTTSGLTAIDGLASNDVWVGDASGRVSRLQAVIPTPYGGACQDVSRLYCNTSLQGHTAPAADGPSKCHGVDAAGGELHYAIDVPINGRLTARVTSRYDVRVSTVASDHRGGCDAATCLGTMPSTDVTVVDVTQGQRIFLVVGAVDDAAPFTLDVECEKR